MINLDLQTVATILILAVSACLQASVGFAAGLLGIPLLIWAGNSLPEAQVLIITAMLPQNALLSWKLREHTHFQEFALPAAVRILFLPLGVAALFWVTNHKAAFVEPLIGSLILLAVVAQLVSGRPWSSAKRWYWIWATFGLSGILQGLSGMSAPPMVLWVYGQRFDPNRARAFLFTVYLSNFIPQLALMVWTFGYPMLRSAVVALAALPLLLVASLIGLQIGNRLGERWLRPATYAILIWMALTCILDPWLHYRHPGVMERRCRGAEPRREGRSENREAERWGCAREPICKPRSPWLEASCPDPPN